MLARLLQASVWVHPSLRCTRIFQSVCQKNSCSLSLSSSIFVGSNPTVCNYSISPAVWILSFGTPKKRYTGVRFRVRERFYSEIRYHSAKREKPLHISRSNAKASLAWEPIPCYPNRCQKNSFRALPEALKLSAAAFAWMIAKINEILIGIIIILFFFIPQKRIDLSQSL